MSKQSECESFKERMQKRRASERRIINIIKNICTDVVVVELYTLLMYLVISPMLRGYSHLGGEWLVGFVIIVFASSANIEGGD